MAGPHRQAGKDLALSHTPHCSTEPTSPRAPSEEKGDHACSGPPRPRSWESHPRLLEYCRNLSWAALQGCFLSGLYQVFLCNIFLLFLKVKETSFLRNTIAECQACGKCFCGGRLILNGAAQAYWRFEERSLDCSLR